MTYLSQHIKSNKQVINNNHVVFVARLLSLIQIIFDKFCPLYYNVNIEIFSLFIKKINLFSQLSVWKFLTSPATKSKIFFL